jgi:hypothetical protein
LQGPANQRPAQSEINMLVSQCLDGGIPDKATLVKEIAG